MREHNVPDWYIASCKKIKYMFPKAHAAAYVMSAIRLGWFKIHKPLEFYAAFFSVAPGGFDGEVVSGGKERVQALMREIDEKIRKKEDNQKDKETMSTMQLVLESMARGIKYLPGRQDPYALQLSAGFRGLCGGKAGAGKGGGRGLLKAGASGAVKSHQGSYGAAGAQPRPGRSFRNQPDHPLLIFRRSEEKIASLRLLFGGEGMFFEKRREKK